MKLSWHILYHAGEASSHSWIGTLTLHPPCRKERGGGLWDLASCRSWHLCKALEQQRYPQWFGVFSSLFSFVYFPFKNKKKNWTWKTTMLKLGFSPFGLLWGIFSGHLEMHPPTCGRDAEATEQHWILHMLFFCIQPVSSNKFCRKIKISPWQNSCCPWRTEDSQFLWDLQKDMSNRSWSEVWFLFPE